MNSPGKGFIVEAYLGDMGGTFRILETLSGTPSQWFNIHDGGYNDTHYFSYSEPHQFEIYSDKTYKRTDKTKKYRIYFGVYQHSHDKDWVPFVDKIEGLMTMEEAAAKEAQEAASRVNSGLYTLVNWEKAFQNREAAQTWLDDIVKRAHSADDVVRARRGLYEQDSRAFKTFPSKSMLDAVLKDKNNLVEAYNRYKPINADIAKILAQGPEFDKKMLPYPGLADGDVTKRIQQYNDDYAKLVDTYPVN